MRSAQSGRMPVKRVPMAMPGREPSSSSPRSAKLALPIDRWPRPEMSVSGTAWTSDPGASSSPPNTVATYISVIVTTSTTKNGNVESGNVAETVVLKVDNPGGYQPSPGSPGSGILVAVVQ